MSSKKIVVVLGLFLWSVSGWLQDLPVKKVVIYKNGISYVERETNLDGEGSIKLKFKSQQMRDVLKTLYAIPLQKGTIQNIDYQSEEPLQKKLEDIYIPLPPENTLTGLLKGLQGVKIKVPTHDEKLTILGVETKKTVAQNGQIIEEPMLVVMDEATNAIKNYSLDGLDFTIEDENIKKDFNKLLLILNSTKFADQKEVTIYYKDFANSPIKVGYVVESPIWKTTYRVFLDAKPSPLLQSFAIVENNTLDDWKDVDVTLVGSGPFSYLIDLYTAIIPSRPTISIEDLFGIVRVPSSIGKLREALKDKNKMDRFVGIGALREAHKAEEEAYEEAKEEKEVARALPLAERISKGLKSISRSKEIGEYFSYEITKPITILRGNAGLLNILSENIDGEKILYYNESDSKDISNALYLKNNTKNVLDNGFVTFFEGQSTVGEGYLKTQLKTGEKEIVTYGIEKSVNIETNLNSKNTNYISVKLTNGILTAQYYSYSEKIYKIFNKSPKAYVLIIDHTKKGDWELVEPVDSNIKEDLPNIYRFRISLQPNSILDFKVLERKLLQEYIYFEISNLQRIMYIISSAKLSANAKKIVEEASKILKEITENEQEMARLVKRNSFLQEQLRIIRDNIYALNTNNPEEAKIRSKHVATLDKYVAEYEQNENKRDELINKNNTLSQNLSQLITSYSE